MKPLLFATLGLLLVSGCGPDEAPVAGGVKRQADGTISLLEARRNFKTRVGNPPKVGKPAPEPPAALFRKIKYLSPVGELQAYLSPDPGDGKTHPAIVWITGGDCNTISDVWTDAPAENDQSAAAYRKAGIIMMFPSLRGGNNNPGKKESFLGEVDDILAATDHLAAQPFVDPKRIYLGGHSTGGTLVLLVAESSDRYRAVFSFGPATDISGYAMEYLPFDMSNIREVLLRSPGRWLHSIKSPVFVFEGLDGGNAAALQAISDATVDPRVQVHAVKGATHFSILAPTNALIARKILQDQGPTINLRFTNDELVQPFTKEVPPPK